MFICPFVGLSHVPCRPDANVQVEFTEIEKIIIIILFQKIVIKE